VSSAVVSVRVDEATRTRFKELLTSSGLSAREWFTRAVTGEVEKKRLVNEIEEAQARAARITGEIEKRLAALERRKTELEAMIQEKQDTVAKLEVDVKELRTYRNELEDGLRRLREHSKTVKEVFSEDLANITAKAKEELANFTAEAVEGILSALKQHELNEQGLVRQLDNARSELVQAAIKLGRDTTIFQSIFRILQGQVDGIQDLINCLLVVRKWIEKQPDIQIFCDTTTDWTLRMAISGVSLSKLLDIQIQALSAYVK